ncbi:hypothetical protein HHJ39_00055 [Escherichia coli]|nr:hypothetical protein HHJ39_00055 [Escherichia coli]
MAGQNLPDMLRPWRHRKPFKAIKWMFWLPQRQLAVWSSTAHSKFQLEMDVANVWL